MPEFATSAPVLNRSILGSLFTILFILEDVPGRCAWFREAEYKESALELKRYMLEYGDDPTMRDYISALEKFSQLALTRTQLTEQEAKDPARLRGWLNPGRMVTNGVSPSALPSNRIFMKFLNDLHYIDLSQQAHLGGLGLIRRAAYFVDGIQGVADETLAKYSKSQLGLAIAFSAALTSEIKAHFGFGLKSRLLYVWKLASDFIGFAKELFDKRYRALLA